MSAAVGSHLASNLAAHQARWGFAPVLGEGDATTVRITQRKSGTPVVALLTSSQQWLAIHDGEPLQEAADWVGRVVPDPLSASSISVIGAGLGDVVHVLAERAPTARLLVLEPEPALMRLALGRHDWSTLIDVGRLMLLCGPVYEGGASAWRMVETAEVPPVVLVHPRTAQARPVAAKAAAHVVGQAVAGARANARARERFATPYLLNTLRNLPLLTVARDVGALTGRHAGALAIVAAAGPSLNRNLEELARIDDWRERAVVIAVDTALKPMLAAGLEPHYVVGVDPSEKNARTLTSLPALRDTWLVAEPSLDPACFAGFGDRIALFRVSDTHEPWLWLSTRGISVGRLRAWGSVLTSAFDLAVEMGADPVALIGADLSYTGGQPYCRDTIYEEDWRAAASGGRTLDDVWRRQLPETELITVDDIRGEPTQSSATLVAFRDWLVAQPPQTPGRRIVNATGAGILRGPGIAQRPLAALFAEQCAQRPGQASGASDTLPAATPAALAAAQSAVLTAAVSAPPAPLAEWVTFTGGRATAGELAVAVADSSPNLLAAQPLLAAELARRAAAAAADAVALAAHAPRPRPSEDAPPQQQLASPGDSCFGPVRHMLLPSGPVSAFRTYHALHLNARRLEHLASLGLPLRRRRVLEVGAGVGDLTDFFLDRGCTVHVTDGRTSHVRILQQRFEGHPLVCVSRLDLDPAPSAPPALVDVVFCYGTLYHLSNPAAALDYLARACGDLLLIDTLVGDDGSDGPNPVTEDATSAGAAISGHGTRPSRAWVDAQLRTRFPHVYVPVTQPNHFEYPVDWTTPSLFQRRSIFIASRRPLDVPGLSDALLDRQQRH